jgi:transposase
VKQVPPDERIETVTDEIETLAKADDSCRRVMTVPGIGPIISSAMVAAIGNGTAFAKGRDYSAWLGLVPKQMSTGDRTTDGKEHKVSFKGRIQKRKTHDLQIITFGLQRAAGPYRRARSRHSLFQFDRDSPDIRSEELVTGRWPVIGLDGELSSAKGQWSPTPTTAIL